MEKINHLVSIIVPAYNASATIGNFINSILKQTYKNIELIVVNDGSTDQTKNIVEEIISKFANYNIKLINQENQGMTKARNTGYLNSSGNFVWFLDSDMELPLGKEIEKCVWKCLTERIDALMIPERSRGSGFWAKCRGFEKVINDYDLNKNAVRFIKREVMEQVGLYNPQLTAAEDYELHNRVKAAGFKFVLITEIFIYHYEVGSVKKMLKKAFHYGETIPLYIKKYPLESFHQFFIVRSAYFKKWKLFLKHPLPGFGLLVIKLMQYFAASLGMLAYLLSLKKYKK